jgi:HD-GYP domain-containing protein (c-di-GMP phosphodiesterase class II)
MSNTRKIEASALHIGMFVSRLDRPWLETPFLFQGFYIRTKHEIGELQHYCNHVYVDIDQSTVDITGRFRVVRTSTLIEKIKRSTWMPSAMRSFLKMLVGIFTRKGKDIAETPAPGYFYQDTVPVKKEIKTAKTIYAGSIDRLTSVLDGIRRGEKIEISAMEAVVNPMVDSVLRNSTAMALMARMRATDDYTYSHSIGSSIWALVFGRHLGLNRESLKALCQGGLLLDVGKTRIPIALLKKPGVLTPEEMDQVRSHVEFGLELVKEIKGIDGRVIEMVATHHERYDGSGYPTGMKGHQIPVFGRMAGIIDSYVAMTSDRPYASAISTYNAMREFKSLSDKSFQSEMVEQFIQAIGIFPAGTLVELNTGEVGVVIKEYSFQRLRPEIALILDSNKEPLSEIRIIDLHGNDKDPDAALTVWIERGIEPGAYDIDPSEYFL